MILYTWKNEGVQTAMLIFILIKLVLLVILIATNIKAVPFWNEFVTEKKKFKAVHCFQFKVAIRLKYRGSGRKPYIKKTNLSLLLDSVKARDLSRNFNRYLCSVDNVMKQSIRGTSTLKLHVN